MIDFQILEMARSFKEAAVRLNRPDPSPDGQPNVLVFPAAHCAILSCELFVKCLDAKTDYETGKNPMNEVVRVFAKAQKGHSQDTALFSGRIGKVLTAQLSQSEIDMLVLWISQASEVLEATARHAIYGVQWRRLDRKWLGLLKDRS